MKKRIAVIGLKGLPAFGGASRVGENIIEQLKYKYEFTVYSISSHASREKPFMNGFRQIVFRKIPFKKLNVLYYYIISAIHALFLGGYDLIHLHHRDAAFIIVLLRIKYRVVLTTHGAFNLLEKWKKYSLYYKIQERFFVRYANLITCVSIHEKEIFESFLKRQVHHIPNGVESVYDPELKAKPKGRYLFFGAGRILRSKGLDVFLKALKRLEFKGHVLIAGDLEQSKDYKKAIHDLSKGLNIKFLGLLKEKRVLFSYIKNARFFVFPSEKEAMSMMLLEAASLNVPIVCSDIEANKAIFSNKEVLFFSTDNDNDLAEKLNWAFANPSKMQEKSECALKKVVSEYSWNIVAKKYDEIYGALIKK